MKTIIKKYYILDENDKKLIKKQMIDLDLTLSKMAKNIGVSKSYISEIISGKKCLTDKIITQFSSQGIIIKKED